MSRALRLVIGIIASVGILAVIYLVWTMLSPDEDKELAANASSVSIRESSAIAVSADEQDEDEEPSESVETDSSSKTGSVTTSNPTNNDKGTVTSAADSPVSVLSYGLKVGNRAYDYEMTLLDGTKQKLSDLQGKPVLLNFWATWCGPCVGEMPDIEKIYNDYGDSVYILGQNSGEDESTVSSFIKKNGFTFPISLDTDDTISNKYNLQYIPVTYILDTNGVIVTVIDGSSDYNTFSRAIEKALKN